MAVDGVVLDLINGKQFVITRFFAEMHTVNKQQNIGAALLNGFNVAFNIGFGIEKLDTVCGCKFIKYPWPCAVIAAEVVANSDDEDFGVGWVEDLAQSVQHEFDEIDLRTKINDLRFVKFGGDFENQNSLTKRSDLTKGNPYSIFKTNQRRSFTSTCRKQFGQMMLNISLRFRPSRTSTLVFSESASCKCSFSRFRLRMDENALGPSFEYK